MKLIISFTDQSKSFTYGVEFGRILQQIQQGNYVASNGGFPVRLENVEVLRRTCEHYGYTPFFGAQYFEECVEFTAIKNVTSQQ